MLNQKIKNIIKSQKEVLELFQNYVTPDRRPLQPASIKDARALQQVETNDVKIDKAMQKLIKSVIDKVSGSSSENALEKCQDAIDYFVKSAREKDYTSNVIREAKTKLVLNYVEFLTDRIGEDFAQNLPTQEEIDVASSKLYAFASKHVNVTDLVIKNNILYAVKEKIGGEQEIRKQLAELEAAASDIMYKPDAENVKNKVAEHNNAIEAKNKKIENLIIEREQNTEETTALKKQLKDKNTIVLDLLMKRPALSDDQLNEIEDMDAGSDKMTQLLDSISETHSPEAQAQLTQQFDKAIQERKELQTKIATLRDNYSRLSKKIAKSSLKTRPADVEAIKKELLQPLLDKANVLMSIGNASYKFA